MYNVRVNSKTTTKKWCSNDLSDNSVCHPCNHYAEKLERVQRKLLIGHVYILGE